MSQPATINPRIIEGLYCEALALSDEVRAAFDLSGRIDALANHARPARTECAQSEDFARVALSCEALRTTTRMMHAIAWLLNYRAFYMGELTEFQLRRHGRLTVDYPQADPRRVTLLDPPMRELIGATERFYARLLRLDAGWRRQDPTAPTAITRLRERLGIAAGRG